MKWSVRLGRLWGIDVFLHFTFLLFLAWIGWSAWLQDGLGAALGVVLMMLTLFGCVLLHEYGHALTARKFGIGTHDITLLPIGGVARLERMPSKPREELLVAIAGPAVNVVIASVTAAWFLLSGRPLPLNPLHLTEGGLPGIVLKMNLMMILFNLLPAFPMDGGRVLRAALAMKMPYVRATRMAATIGQGMAVLFALAGLLNNHYMLLFIAIFVWIGASNEADAAEEDSLLSGLRVQDAMLTDYRHLTPMDTPNHTRELILQSWQADFPVMENGVCTGIVTRHDVVTALAAGGGEEPVSRIMRPVAFHCAPEDALDVSYETLRTSNLPLLPVVHLGRLAGLLTSENVLETLMFRRAAKAGCAVRGGMPSPVR